ncbi:cysteine synthase family protein [Pendulispora brunnea]|uniref:Cysteine synthase family protein n=1 Tax=Pendulispora brunnea TaxID=2905690 RepID=A0ABZ2KIQ0_9BACT
MAIRTSQSDIIEALVLPRIVRLGPNLYGAAFCLMKLLPARFILDRARAAGILEPGGVVIETSSGTFGLALAMLCRLRGYQLILVSDPAIEPPLQRRLEQLGARVEIVRTPASVGGYQGARLARMAELQAEFPRHFWPSQYDNPDNPRAYAPFAELLAESVGHVGVLVGAVGSGGSMCGTTSYLRSVFPEMTAVGVDTHRSTLFGQADGKRLLRGLGNSLMPRNVDHTTFDEIHWVSASDGFSGTRALHAEHALYMGPTSGAGYLVAKWWAARRPEVNVVVTLPDEGYRYQDTVYNDAWLRENDVYRDGLPDNPRRVNHPHDAGPDWSYLSWNRKSYEHVLGTTFSQVAVSP